MAPETAAGEAPYVCSLPAEIQAVAQKELNEVPHTRDESVAHIRAWMLKQPHLHGRTDTQTILRFLRGCKFSLERTKEKIDTYYTCKSALPEMFKGRDPTSQTLAEIFQLRLMVVLPGYDALGRKVVLGRLGAWSPSQTRPEDLFRAASMLFDVLFGEDEQVSVTGFVQVHDMAGIAIKHAAALNATLVKKVMTVWTQGYPIRPKAVHYVNTTPAFDTIFNLFTRFMKDKMKNRIKLHGSNFDSLFQDVPKEMFPSEYGGKSGTMKELTDELLEKILAHRSWFQEEEIYQVDESKRCGGGHSRTIKDIFGVDGSFRKLELD